MLQTMVLLGRRKGTESFTPRAVIKGDASNMGEVARRLGGEPTEIYVGGIPLYLKINFSYEKVSSDKHWRELPSKDDIAFKRVDENGRELDPSCLIHFDKDTKELIGEYMIWRVCSIS